MKERNVVENPDSTYTPVPATITPAGLELDPDTPATLDNDETEKTKLVKIHHILNTLRRYLSNETQGRAGEKTIT